MKYFIDFEATQFSQEIISIGCIREDGQTFYALVAPKKGKITPFITNLTGITAEMIDSAMSADAVFSKFYDWLFENLDDAPEFLVWEILTEILFDILLVMRPRLKQKWRWDIFVAIIEIMPRCAKKS